MKLRTYDEGEFRTLIARFLSSVKRKKDRRLADDLTQDLLSPSRSVLRRETLIRLARWCNTSGIYGEGMVVARQISALLFGEVLDRTEYGL
jgi:hypothetical protein